MRPAGSGMLAAVLVPKYATVRAVLVVQREVQLLRVEQREDALTIEGLVADAGDWHIPGGQVVGGGDAEEGVRTDAVHTALVASIEGLAGGDERAIGILGRQVDVAIVGAEQRHRIARAVVQRVSQQLQAQLVVADLSVEIVVAQRCEVIQHIGTAVGG